jgi:hypothetical protein
MLIYSDNNLRLKILQTVAQIKYNEYLLASLNPPNTPTTAIISSSSPSATALNSTQSPQVATTATGQGIHSSIFKSYEKWLSDYRDYRSIIAAFINASNLMESQRYDEATQFYCVACEYNERITSYIKDKMKGMDHDFLLANRRKCLKLWNQLTIRKFTHKSSRSPNLDNLLSASGAHNLQIQQPLTQQELNALIETMINKFLPCFFRLLTSTSEDKAMIEEIRQDWLNVLDSNLPGKRWRSLDRKLIKKIVIFYFTKF